MLAKIAAFLNGASSRRIKYKTIGYVRHARRRMKWRKISEEEIRRTLNNPDQVTPLEDNKYHAYKIIESRNIRVTYRLLTDALIVLSVVDKSD